MRNFKMRNNQLCKKSHIIRIINEMQLLLSIKKGGVKSE